MREDNGHFLRSTDCGEAGPMELPEYPFGGSLVLAASQSGKIPSDEDTAIYVVWDQDTNTHVGLHETKNPAIEGRFEINGVKVTTAYTLLKEQMETCPPEWAEAITEVPTDTIVELARMYACDTPSTLSLIHI